RSHLYSQQLHNSILHTRESNGDSTLLAPLENRLGNPYARRLHDEYNRQYSLAALARSKGLDPSAKVESQTTYDLAARVEKAVGPVGMAERFSELVKMISAEETALKV